MMTALIRGEDGDTNPILSTGSTSPKPKPPKPKPGCNLPSPAVTSPPQQQTTLYQTYNHIIGKLVNLYRNADTWVIHTP